MLHATTPNLRYTRPLAATMLCRMATSLIYFTLLFFAFLRCVFSRNVHNKMSTRCNMAAIFFTKNDKNALLNCRISAVSRYFVHSIFKRSAKKLPLIAAVNYEISKRYLEVCREKNIEQELR